MKRKMLPLLVGAGSVAACLALWEILGRWYVDPIFLSMPSEVFRVGMGFVASGEIFRHLQASAVPFVLGFSAAAALSVLVGVAAGWFPIFHWLTNPIISLLYVVPVYGLVPMIILWFGIGLLSKVVVVFLFAFVPMVMIIRHEVQTGSSELAEMAQSFSASSAKILRSIVIPAALPTIFAALAVGMGRAIKGVFFAEMIAASVGLGFFVISSTQSFEIGAAFFGLSLFAVTGFGCFWLLRLIERRFGRWYLEDSRYE